MTFDPRGGGEDIAQSLTQSLTQTLTRIADALERLAPPASPLPDFTAAPAFVWRSHPHRFCPVPQLRAMPLDLLVGIDRPLQILLENTQYFTKGLPANNALLWGARGMGKSSLVKAVYAHVREKMAPKRLSLIEISRDDLSHIPDLLAQLRAVSDWRFLLFCDDLSFSEDETQYKNLKAVLDGGVEGCPPNVLLYATSNRRHLMPRDMIENERQEGLHPAESVEEKVSLSDRFGLWLGFYASSQDEYLAMIAGYCQAYGLPVTPDQWRAEALEWQVTRGARSGRVAWQFFCNLAARYGKKLDELGTK